jgi:hypothetical protein
VKKLIEGLKVTAGGLIALCIMGIMFGFPLFIMYAIVHFIIKYW